MWRFTKEQKYRDWAWEAVQVRLLDKHYFKYNYKWGLAQSKKGQFKHRLDQKRPKSFLCQSNFGESFFVPIMVQSSLSHF